MIAFRCILFLYMGAVTYAPITPGLLTPFYVGGAAFDGLERSSVYLMKMLLEWVDGWEYFPDPVKSLFIAHFPDQ